MSENTVEIVNSYDNTEELSQKFPVVNPTAISDEMGRKIQNRLLSGFENWNRGFDAWKAWGNILYVPESIYNVHGARLTLAQYQAAMNIVLKRTRIDMGQFRNMIIRDNWTAIHYDIFTHVGDQVIPGSVMEFVNFKDFGPELGVRVDEGWGGPRDSSYQGMAMFQGDAEREHQKKDFDALLAYEIPQTDDLKAKYPVKNPTSDDSPWAEEMRMAILQDFDAWNQGMDAWQKNVDTIYAKDACIVLSNGAHLTPAAYKAEMAKQAESTQVCKKYFDSMLISGEWIAIHYNIVTTDCKTGEKTPGDMMQFFRFVKDENGFRVTENWIK